MLVSPCFLEHLLAPAAADSGQGRQPAKSGTRAQRVTLAAVGSGCGNRPCFSDFSRQVPDQVLDGTAARNAAVDLHHVVIPAIVEPLRIGCSRNGRANLIALRGCIPVDLLGLDPQRLGLGQRDRKAVWLGVRHWISPWVETLVQSGPRRGAARVPIGRSRARALSA